jgi:hypothetical protein
LRAELREAERQWDESVERLETEAHEYAQTRIAPARAEALVPAREQVHQALTLLGAPAASRLIVAVHDAFYAGRLPARRATASRAMRRRLLGPGSSSSGHASSSSLSVGSTGSGKSSSHPGPGWPVGSAGG